MAFTYDLFISYKSEDRPWASRFYEDLRRSYPSLRVFFDRDSLTAGLPFRQALETAIRASAHCVVFWSDLAAASSEVLDEVKAFQAHIALQPDADAGKRTLFYVPLQGSHPPLEALQGFAELRKLKVYDPTRAGYGTERLAETAIRLEWQRMLRKIGDACMASYATQPVTLAILAMNTSIVNKLDADFDTDGLVPGPSLKVLLLNLDANPPAVAAGATSAQRTATEDARAVQLLQDLKTRYGSTALEWLPFRTQETVVDFMEQLRVEANARLLPEFRFHWVPKDLYAEIARPGTSPEDLRKYLEDLAATPSVIIVDQLSLYNLRVYSVFTRLNEYAKKETGVIISLSPTYMAATDVAVNSMVGLGEAVLGAFFEPQIPGTGAFARCAVNVQNTVEAKRLIRSSLGMFYLQQKLKQGDPVTKG